MLMLMIMVDDKPEADRSTVICVKCAEQQFLHITGLPDLDHDYFDDDLDDDNCDCDHYDHDCDV